MSDQTAPRPRGWRGIHYRLYDWVLHWAAHPHAQSALLLIAMAESSVFPIPPDVLLIAMCVARPQHAMRYAAFAGVGSVIGGMLGYGIGWGLWEIVSDGFYRWVPGFNPEIYERVAALYDRWNFWVVFTAGFTPIPYKVFTIAAGVTRINFAVFLIASAISRSARFFLVAFLIRRFGASVMPFVEKYLGWLTIVFVVLLIGGFYSLRFLGGH
jgi:membrane protein YqaA with SNARE-associated domain